MAKYRRYKKYKRSYKKFKSFKKSGKSFYKKVKSIVQAQAEHKYNVSPTPTNALNVTPVPQQTYSLVTMFNQIAQGDDKNQRTGNAINLRYISWNAKFRVAYGNPTVDPSEMNDTPDDFWVHICQPLKGQCGQNATTFAANLATYFNNVNNMSASCMYKPNIDVMTAKFRIIKTFKVKPGNQGFLGVGNVAGGTKYNYTTRIDYGLGRWRWKKFGGKKFQYSIGADTLPMNTSYSAVIINNCPVANNTSLYCNWSLINTFTDI